ncbi:NUDIX domain-containing protein [Zhihengliuella sp.]|uniref:8-oxo-dGTP diphosphatase n=1 Tax=Zhihengliuella sp. TaxID=1954483 RepID=UPI00281205FE|nr:NUDIX domain-containing protein [Zhihengliuella sp.]
MSGPTRVVLCAVVRTEDDGAPAVLLGVKLRGFAAGKTVLPGGKIEPGESPVEAAVRELAEETGLEVSAAALSSVREVARIDFVFPNQPAADMDCTVFRVAAGARTAGGAAVVTGEPVETDELRPVWHRLDALPAESMWQDSARWLPDVVAPAGDGVTRVRVVLAADNETVAEYTATVLDPAD